MTSCQGWFVRQNKPPRNNRVNSLIPNRQPAYQPTSLLFDSSACYAPPCFLSALPCDLTALIDSLPSLSLLVMPMPILAHLS